MQLSSAETDFAHTMAQVLDTDVVVRGGQSPLPEPGTPFSGSYGRTLEEAASGVVLGTIGPVNERHIHVTEGPGATVFSDLFPDPVPKQDRVEGRPSN